LLDDLTEMLRDLFDQRSRGVPMSRLARTHGYVDGYMRMMLDSGVATKAELLSIVSLQRSTSHGPALRVLDESVEAA
jgi:hypothetical protein